MSKEFKEAKARFYYQTAVAIANNNYSCLNLVPGCIGCPLHISSCNSGHGKGSKGCKKKINDYIKKYRFKCPKVWIKNKLKNVSFGKVLQHLKVCEDPELVSFRREAWPKEKSIWRTALDNREYDLNGKTVVRSDYLYTVDEDDTVSPYTPSQRDMFEEDWIEIRS